MYQWRWIESVSKNIRFRQRRQAGVLDQGGGGRLRDTLRPAPGVLARGIGGRLPPAKATSRRRDCHFADVPSLTLLKHLLQEEGGAVERQSRQRLKATPST